jgi:hypothetical protein
MSFLLPLLANPSIMTAIAGLGIGFGAGTLASGPESTIVNQEGSNPQISTQTGTTSNDTGLFGGAIGDIIKILGPVLLLSMIGGGGGGGLFGGLFGGSRGSTSSSTAPVIIVQDDDN